MAPPQIEGAVFEGDPWWMAGWVDEETPLPFVTELNQTHYRCIGEAWLNVEDDGIWLRSIRQR